MSIDWARVGDWEFWTAELAGCSLAAEHLGGEWMGRADGPLGHRCRRAASLEEAQRISVELARELALEAQAKAAAVLGDLGGDGR